MKIIGKICGKFEALTLVLYNKLHKYLALVRLWNMSAYLVYNYFVNRGDFFKEFIYNVDNDVNYDNNVTAKGVGFLE